jgi:hypothetical protein
MAAAFAIEEFAFKSTMCWPYNGAVAILLAVMPTALIGCAVWVTEDTLPFAFTENPLAGIGGSIRVRRNAKTIGPRLTSPPIVAKAIGVDERNLPFRHAVLEGA